MAACSLTRMVLAGVRAYTERWQRLRIYRLGCVRTGSGNGWPIYGPEQDHVVLRAQHTIRGRRQTLPGGPALPGGDMAHTALPGVWWIVPTAELLLPGSYQALELAQALVAQRA